MVMMTDISGPLAHQMPLHNHRGGLVQPSLVMNHHLDMECHGTDIRISKWISQPYPWYTYIIRRVTHNFVTVTVDLMGHSRSVLGTLQPPLISGARLRMTILHLSIKTTGAMTYLGGWLSLVMMVMVWYRDLMWHSRPRNVLQEMAVSSFVVWDVRLFL